MSTTHFINNAENTPNIARDALNITIETKYKTLLFPITRIVLTSRFHVLIFFFIFASMLPSFSHK